MEQGVRVAVDRAGGGRPPAGVQVLKAQGAGLGMQSLRGRLGADLGELKVTGAVLSRRRGWTGGSCAGCLEVALSA